MKIKNNDISLVSFIKIILMTICVDPEARSSILC